MFSLQDFIFKIQGYDINKAYLYLNKIKEMSAKDFSDWKKKKRWEIAKYHFNKNEYYRSKISGSFPKKWDSLPIIKKSDFQIDLAKILSAPFNKSNVYIANTSGSSGHPFYFAKDKECHSLTWAYMRWRYGEIGLSSNDLQARFCGIPLDFLPKMKENMKDFFLNRIRFPVYDFSNENLFKFLDKFKKNKISYIYGYTNSIVLFCRFLIKNKINLIKICPSIKLVIVTSEVCTEEDRKIITKAINVPIYDEYGASEFSYIGYQYDTHLWQVAEDMVFVEKGINGSILVTDLHNKAFPFIRYDIGDNAHILKKAGHTYIKSLDGRQNDTIILPSGKKAAGLTFYYISRSILENSGILKEFIIRQVALNKFIFDVVTDRPLNKNEILDIQSSLDKYLEKDLKLEVNRVNEISRPPSGKIKHFYSEI